MTRLTRVLGLALVAILVAGGAFGIVAAFFQQIEVHTDTVSRPVRAVQVRGATGDLTARTGRTGEPLRITRRLHWSFEKPVQAEQLTIKNEVATISSGCHSFGFGDCSVDVDVVLPPGVALDVEVTTGDISLTGLDADVRVTTNTTTGDVRATGLRTATLHETSTTGNVSASFDEPPSAVSVHTTTGDVDVQLPTGPALPGHHVDEYRHHEGGRHRRSRRDPAGRRGDHHRRRDGALIRHPVMANPRVSTAP